MENKLYDYSPITHRSKWKLPNGARVAFSIGLNIEHYQIDQPSTSIFGGTANLVPDPLNYGWRDYGPRVGIWIIMVVLDKCGIPASVLLNSDVCTHYPQIIEEGKKRNWAWLAHGKNNSILQTSMDIEEERAYLQEITSTIQNHTGTQPKGWLGPELTETFNTPDLLEELGYSYVCDWCNDDQPFQLNTKQRNMISVPYSIEVNDIPLFVGKSLSGEDFYQLLVDQFEVLYEEGAETGRVMCLSLHPFVTGLPFRSKYLDKALEFITSHSNVWVTTSDEIAEWYLDNSETDNQNTTEGLKKVSSL